MRAGREKKRIAEKRQNKLREQFVDRRVPFLVLLEYL
jgi:hypothetical protein